MTYQSFATLVVNLSPSKCEFDGTDICRVGRGRADLTHF